jgi:hypothetical protein
MSRKLPFPFLSSPPFIFPFVRRQQRRRRHMWPHDSKLGRDQFRFNAMFNLSCFCRRQKKSVRIFLRSFPVWCNSFLVRSYRMCGWKELTGPPFSTLMSFLQQSRYWGNCFFLMEVIDVIKFKCSVLNTLKLYLKVCRSIEIEGKWAQNSICLWFRNAKLFW